MSKTKHQAFEIQLMRRADLAAAPYNPRMISPYAREQLKAKIQAVGLVEPLVWNMRTGNLVSGHQRLSILDQLEGTDQYELEMSVVNLDQAAEKELVVFLNNTTAQGTWNEDLLAELLKDTGVTLEGMGWTPADLQIEFPDLPVPEHLQPTGEAGFVAEQEAAVQESVDEFDAIKEARKKAREEARGDVQNDADYVLVIAFQTSKDKSQFLRVNGMMAGVTHMTADELAMLLKPEHQWRLSAAEPPPAPEQT